MSEASKEIIRYQLITFLTEQEVCDLLNITVEQLLEAFYERFNEYVDGESDEID